jgi:glyoxylate reductase
MVTPAIFVTRRLPSAVLSKLRAVGDVDVYTGDAAIPAPELRARIAGTRALVCLATDLIDQPVIDLAPGLNVIANVGAGCNNIDVACARSRGIVVTDTADVLTESVADFTWALMFAITRRLAEGKGGRSICCSAANCAAGSSASSAPAASAAPLPRAPRRSG